MRRNPSHFRVRTSAPWHRRSGNWWPAPRRSTPTGWWWPTTSAVKLTSARSPRRRRRGGGRSARPGRAPRRRCVLAAADGARVDRAAGRARHAVGAVQNSADPAAPDRRGRAHHSQVGTSAGHRPPLRSRGSTTPPWSRAFGLPALVVDLGRRGAARLRLPSAATPRCSRRRRPTLLTFRWAYYFVLGDQLRRRGSSRQRLLADGVARRGWSRGSASARATCYSIAWPFTHIGGMTMLTTALRGRRRDLSCSTAGTRPTTPERMAAHEPIHPRLGHTVLPGVPRRPGPQRGHAAHEGCGRASAAAPRSRPGSAASWPRSSGSTASCRPTGSPSSPSPPARAPTSPVWARRWGVSSRG